MSSICDTCNYKRINKGGPGHCYAFKEKPGFCGQYRISAPVDTSQGMDQLFTPLNKRTPRSEYSGKCADLANNIKLGNTLPDDQQWMGD